jgi:hypothetical protein
MTSYDRTEIIEVAKDNLKKAFAKLQQDADKRGVNISKAVQAAWDEFFIEQVVKNEAFDQMSYVTVNDYLYYSEVSGWSLMIEVGEKVIGNFSQLTHVTKEYFINDYLGEVPNEREVSDSTSTEPEPNYSFPPASSSEQLYDIWCTDGKKSEVVETLPFSSQEKADIHASDMDFENNEYWAQVKP